MKKKGKSDILIVINKRDSFYIIYGLKVSQSHKSKSIENTGLDL